MMIDEILEHAPPIEDVGGIVYVNAEDIQCCVRATEVAELAQHDARALTAMPCVRLPFVCMWIEWSRGGVHYGVLARELNDHTTLFLHMMTIRPGQINEHGCLFLYLDDKGQPKGLWHPEDLQRILEDCAPALRRLANCATEEGQEMARIASLTICLMHCKNVSAVEQVPPAKLQKARQRRGKRPLVRYHVLNIQPMAKVLRREGGLGSGTGLAQALHICRGHFKDFRQSGLFGRVKGIFWWDQHARGERDKGVVVKDYNIVAPTSAELGGDS